MGILQPSQMELPNAPQNDQNPMDNALGGSGILEPTQISSQGQNVSPDSTNPPQSTPQGPQLSNTGSFVGNAINSGENFLGNLGNAVIHPINTVENVGKGLIGAGENLGAVITDKPQLQNTFTQTANNIGNYITQRYGSLKAAGQTAYQDPVGFLADASAILSGVGGAGEALTDAGSDAAKAAASGAAGTDFIAGNEGITTPEAIQASEGPSTANQFFQGVSKAGENANPLSLAGKGISAVLPKGNFVGNLAAKVLGGTTGSGASSVTEGLNAGLEGNKDFINATRGNLSESDIAQNAFTARDNLVAQKNATYAEQLSKIKNIDTPQDFSPVMDTLKEQLKNNDININKDGLDFKSANGGIGARGFQSTGDQAVLQNVYDKLNNWMSNGSQTIYNGDVIKQQLGDMGDQVDWNSKAGAIITKVKSQLSETLKASSPEYKNLVEPYESTMGTLNEFKNELLNKNGNIETAIRKLSKAMSSNSGYKQSLLDQLNKTAPDGVNLKAQLAGLNMKDWNTSSKLLGYGEIGTMLFHPSLLPAFLASSPRAVAEFLNAAGYSASKIDQGLSLLKNYKVAIGYNAASRINASSQGTQSTQ